MLKSLHLGGRIFPQGVKSEKISSPISMILVSIVFSHRPYNFCNRPRGLNQVFPRSFGQTNRQTFLKFRVSSIFAKKPHRDFSIKTPILQQQNE